MSASLTRRLTRLVRARPVSEADLAQAERYVRDWLGSYVAGAAASGGAGIVAYARHGSDIESATLVAAALSHVTETDDLHNASVTHPGCVVIPVALRLGERLGLSGHAVLASVLAGYEVMTRIGEALGPAHYRIFHNTSTAGVFGSAAAAASLLGLEEDAWVWALGNAGTQAAGLWQFNEEGAMSKPLHAGNAASGGLRAALLAAEGLSGAERILEGDKGLFRALCPDARPEAVLAEASGWKLTETSMKPYPCCRHVHSAIDAALELHERLGGVDPAAERGAEARAVTGSARIHVDSYPAALDVTDRPHPRTPHEARFSMQYAVASTLLRGRPGLDTFEHDALRDHTVRTWLDRTTVEPSPDLARAYPRRWGARVAVHTPTGETLEASRDGASGDPDRPLDDAALDAKVAGLFAWAEVPDERGRALLEACRGLVEDGPVAGLLGVRSDAVRG